MVPKLDISLEQLSLKSADGVQPFRDLFLSLKASPLLSVLGIFSFYLLTVRVLRFRRITKLQQHYNYPTRASLSQMTDTEAWEIQKTMLQLEFPSLFFQSLQFALFRTYGIPTISQTLVKTRQLSDARFSGKRYVDTCVMIGEFMVHGPNSVRSRMGISRTKYLHHGYRKSGSVREEDMLYTLSLFATEPINFINLYEWRPATDLERCAMGVFWKSIGDALGIDYADFLPSAAKKSVNGEKCQQSFRDGIHWLEEVRAWALEYEKRAMVPAQSNKETADQTTAVLNYFVPGPLKFIGNWFVASMMDERLRLSMMYPRAPWLACRFFQLVFVIRKFVLRYLCLPRPEFMRVLNFTPQPDASTGAYYAIRWDAEPFYIKPTLWNRWLSPAAIVSRLMGLPLPGDQGNKYCSQGYDLASMGPASFEGKGSEYMKKEMEVLERERRGQCPFLS